MFISINLLKSEQSRIEKLARQYAKDNSIKSYELNIKTLEDLKNKE